MFVALALAASLVTIPPGWIDLVGANSDPDPLVQLANGGQFSRFAISADRAAFFAVVEGPDLGSLDDRALDAIISGMRTCSVDDRAFVRIHGRRTGRIATTCKHGDEQVRGLLYVVPTAGATVSLMYSSSDYEKYEAAFEAAAAASIVALNPAWWALSRDEALLFALLVTVSFLLFSAVLLRRKARLKLRAV